MYITVQLKKTLDISQQDYRKFNMDIGAYVFYISSFIQMNQEITDLAKVVIMLNNSSIDKKLPLIIDHRKVSKVIIIEKPFDLDKFSNLNSKERLSIIYNHITESLEILNNQFKSNYCLDKNIDINKDLSTYEYIYHSISFKDSIISLKYIYSENFMKIFLTVNHGNSLILKEFIPPNEYRMLLYLGKIKMTGNIILIKSREIDNRWRIKINEGNKLELIENLDRSIFVN